MSRVNLNPRPLRRLILRRPSRPAPRGFRAGSLQGAPALPQPTGPGTEQDPRPRQAPAPAPPRPAPRGFRAGSWQGAPALPQPTGPETEQDSRPRQFPAPGWPAAPAWGARPVSRLTTWGG